ncbi:cation:proton antiporter [Thermosphaera sp.]
MVSTIALYIYTGWLFSKLLGIYFKIKNLGELPGYIMGSLIIAMLFRGLVNYEDLSLVAEISSILIVFHAGLTSDFTEVLENFKKALVMSLSAVLFTFLTVVFILLYMGFPVETALLIAVLFSNTATETTALVLEKLGTQLKNLLVSASFIDDIIVLFIATAYFNILKGVGGLDLILSLIISVTMLALVMQVGRFRGRFAKFFIKMSRSHESFVDITTIVLTAMVAMFLVFKGSGLIAAYLAGLLVSIGAAIKDPLLRFKPRIIDFSVMLDSFIDSIFIPLFLLYVSPLIVRPGIDLTFVFFVFTGAVLGKFLPYFLFLRHDQRFRGDAVVAGLCMSGRGVLEMVLVVYGMSLGLLPETLVNSILVVSVSTSLFAMFSTGLWGRRIS